MFQNLFILMKKGKKRKKSGLHCSLNITLLTIPQLIVYFKGNNYSQLLEVRPFPNSLTYFDPYKEIIFDNWEKACSDSSLLLDFADIYCVLAR